MNNSTKELNLKEMENVSGGFFPIIIGGLFLASVGLIGYGCYKGYQENKK